YDLVMVHEIMVIQRLVAVTMVPTFVGCPALDFIERDVKAAVEKIPWVDGCQVEFTFRHQWSTDAITEKGKEQLKKHGVAPPPENNIPRYMWEVTWTKSISQYTLMNNVFVQAPCRRNV